MVPELKPADDESQARSIWQACRAWMRAYGRRWQTMKPVAEHLITGQRGELRAYKYLCEQGYSVVAHHYRQPGMREEIDFIAWEGGELVMVEVKTRGAHDWCGPEAAVNAEKLRHLRRLGGRYARRHRVARFRIDVVAIEENPPAPALIRLHRGKNEAAHAPG